MFQFTFRTKTKLLIFIETEGSSRLPHIKFEFYGLVTKSISIISFNIVRDIW